MSTANKKLNRSNQSVQFSKNFQLERAEILNCAQTNDVAPSTRPQNWSEYLLGGQIAPDDFMTGVEKLFVQEQTR